MSYRHSQYDNMNGNDDQRFDQYGQPIYDDDINNNNNNMNQQQNNIQEDYYNNSELEFNSNQYDNHHNNNNNNNNMDMDSISINPEDRYIEQESYSDYSSHPNGGNMNQSRYENDYTPSNLSYGSNPNMSSSSQDRSDSNLPNSTSNFFPQDPYPAWTADPEAPVDIKQIEDIFIDLTNKFGFQRDSMRNMFDHLMTLLDSRSSRMSPKQALLSLHADYIGGDRANYKKWYFAAQLDLDDAVGFRNVSLNKLNKKSRNAKKSHRKILKNLTNEMDPQQLEYALNELESDNSLQAADFRWKYKMNQLTALEMIRHLALYLLVWGEANQVRFTPECLCFIFKCALDYLESPFSNEQTLPEGDYLNRVITPIYKFIRNQVYEISDGRYVKREKDHNKVIGYDDVNQLFWYPAGINKIILTNGTKLTDLPPEERFLNLGNVSWDDVFFKTYFETRTWLHMVTNFNRIWVLHATVYWMYVAFNATTFYTHNYQQLANNQPLGAYKWASCALAGTVACVIQLAATICEWFFVPRKWAGAQHLTRRCIFICLLLGINLAPIAWFYAYQDDTVYSKTGRIVAIVFFFVAIVTMVFFSVMPLGGLFTSYMNKSSRRYVSSQTFTASFAPLHGWNRILSYLVWIVVFGAKYAESYFFLILCSRHPIRILSTMTMRCTGEYWWGAKLCRQQPKITLGLMIATDFVLFFLDTYLWYIIVNTVFSVGKAFYLGMSVLTPWRNIFTRLPKRIYLKILATNDMEIKYKPKVLISQVWNAIIISMYREHLLAIDHVQQLLYHQVPSEVQGKRTLRAPTFFTSQDDHKLKMEFFPSDSEAERRISFFAQSLATPMPQPVSVDNMPTFTVLTPHYSERILLSLREIIREDDQFSRVTLLEYLKQLHPVEWECFVKDTKILADETAAYEGIDEEPEKGDNASGDIDDLPFYCIGFKSAAPEYTLRTRIWASLRSQTLYRTVSGFMNYARAIKLLYRVENPEVVQMFGDNAEELERELEKMSRRKFKFLVSMQRLAKFKPHEMENAEFLLRAYPDLQIAYLDEEPPLREGDEPRIYSAVIDGHCELLENGRRRPKFRVQLSGNPILGDGKSDNQNHAIIFYRGEYIQLIDANQDNYLEECLKIRSVLAEFEELDVIPQNPYAPEIEYEDQNDNHPVAIVGAREYIFSENSGVLGDVAAGKEQTFGTLFARTLAQIGAKLHYGHPDFINATFMTTRGGVSKAQKGLHLNEDIYAGMNATLRGGRIKHVEYYQCGKGRDLGFGTILNFTTKIGAGMGEQMLSREYYYLGTQLPIDRFLSFYYAHPGFHLNNLFIQLSLQMFMLTLVNLHSLAHEAIFCDYDRNKPITDILYPIGCYNMSPVVDWVRRYTLSIFIVFFIAFVPMVCQELIERGTWKALLRFCRHILSLSPMFEVFAGQIYSAALLSDLTVGGARYISTGRGFATSRIPFSILYSRFASSAIYMGARSLLMLLFGTVAHWQSPLLWFWGSLAALVYSPFIFNPHQLSWDDFFLDYRDYVRWLSRGNSKYHKNSWIGYIRMTRSRVTGFKRKLIGDESEKAMGDSSRAHRTNLFLAEIFPCFIYATGCFIAFTFINAQTGAVTTDADRVNSVLRIIICTLGPIGIDMAVLAFCLSMSCCCNAMFHNCHKNPGSLLAAFAHGVAVCAHIGMFIVMWVLEGFSFVKMLIGVVTCIQCQRFVYQVMSVLLLTREYKNDHANTAFWTGSWGGADNAFQQCCREYLVKIMELSEFSADFILGHIILLTHFPLLLIPGIDRLHSMMLFWLKPSRQIRPPIFSIKQTRLRKRMVRKYFVLYVLILILAAGCIVGPAVAAAYVPDRIASNLTGAGHNLFQPRNVNQNDTGISMSTYAGHYYTQTPSIKAWSTKT